MSESEREREGEGVERESRAENRRKWKGISFGVESKCIKDGKEGKWEKGRKEMGRSYSLMRDANSAGCFLRLGVVDLEKKRCSICILKSRGERGDWFSMAEMLQKLGVNLDRKENKQEERVIGRSYVEMVKKPRSKDSKTIKVEVKGEEISRNLSR
ncbi:hypothetical protein CK203_028247 [Vitis vinifera]|uniref:Uncharacterized protein n=1 Tax=Vitis vinifera TaxID=29760 RepID=A0A438IAY7_VITVI|nr:hypothetical protein CK203_028247 [Vitis vinifera]